MTDIIITVQGGVIQEIEGIPEGVRVIVRDYDTEGHFHGAEEGEGPEYIESIWEASNPPGPDDPHAFEDLDEDDTCPDCKDDGSWPEPRCPECARSFGPHYTGPCNH